MKKTSPYKVVKSRYVSEKAHILQSLQEADGNPCIRRCESAKYVFIVNSKATKPEIALAVEEIYAEENIKVKSVNVINVKPKKKGRSRSRRPGYKPGRRKAYVTLQAGDQIKE